VGQEKGVGSGLVVVMPGSVDLLWSCGVSGFVVVMGSQWICCGHVGSVG